MTLTIFHLIKAHSVQSAVVNSSSIYDVRNKLSIENGFRLENLDTLSARTLAKTTRCDIVQSAVINT